MLSQLLSINQEMNRKDVEIENMRLENDHLSNELIFEKEFIEIMNKPKEVVRYYEALMRSQRKP